MSKFFTDFITLEDKLAKLLAEKNLLHVTDARSYPITLTVTQNQASDAQMEIWSTADGRTSSQDSVLQFIFNLDGMEIHTNSRLVISDALMSKIKGLAKKIHAAYVHAYFASTVNSHGADDTETEDVDAGDFAEFYDEENDDE